VSLRYPLIGLIVLCSLGIIFVIRHQIAPPPAHQVAEAPPAPKAELLVAARTLPAGTLIKDEDFNTKSILQSDVPEGALVNSPDVRASLRGALLRRYLDPNSPIMAGDVLRPRDRGFLAAVLEPGSRAVAVGVDGVSGVGGLIWPGDRVDLILTQELGDKDAPASKRFAGETVLNNVRVVAVDQSIAQGAVAANDNATAIGRLARTVTLEVTPRQAERAAVAQRLGHLTLAIRSVEGIPEATGKIAGPIYGGDVSAALAGPERPEAARVRVIQGSNSTEVVFR
jgi:pilus assembly protein CpaB